MVCLAKHALTRTALSALLCEALQWRIWWRLHFGAQGVESICKALPYHDILILFADRGVGTIVKELAIPVLWRKDSPVTVDTGAIVSPEEV